MLDMKIEELQQIIQALYSAMEDVKEPPKAITVTKMVKVGARQELMSYCVDFRNNHGLSDSF